MKFKVEQVAKETEESVNVYCYDPQEDWVNKVQEAALGQVVVCGNMEGEIHQVRLAEIYYFEVVDGSSFIYTKIMIVSFFMSLLFGQGTVMNIVTYLGQCMLFALIAVLSLFVYHSESELTQKQWWVRTFLHLLLLEAVLIPIAYCWHFCYSPTDAVIYAIFILFGKMLWHLVDFGFSVKTAADINKFIRNRKKADTKI